MSAQARPAGAARTHVLAVARKELAGYFGSAVALLFLAGFLAAVLFTFFWVDKAFARGIADVRPMFDRLPLLLVFLVSALSMRLWSEEHRSGTIEVLMTLPVPRHQLVLGKFLAGLALVALALALTLPLPITVSMMGDLDWGPVVGGYLAALLLAGAYLAIGLCVSAATDNQIVSLLGTAAIGLLLLFADAIADFAGGTRRGALVVALGRGAAYLDVDGHFASIARGVLDLRDLGFYLSLIAGCLALNVFLLVARRWSKGAGARRQRRAAAIAILLVAANAIALNLWLAPTTSARVDLTEHGEFSVSPVTRDLLRSLDQPLVLRAYVSEKTHPLLAPLIPRVLDTLEEYRVDGGGKVRVEVVDPTTDEALAKEALEGYDVKPVPFQIADRNQQAIVNAYFHVLVLYGDQHAVLSFQDVIDVEPPVEMGKPPIVRLRNLEYDLTKTIKKVASGFQSVEAMFAALPGKAKLTAYVTPATLPPDLAKLPELLRAVSDKLGKQASGKFEFAEVEPKTDAERRALYEQHGVRPAPASLLSRDVFYAHLLLEIGGKAVPVESPQDMTEAALETAVTNAVKKAAPGFVKRVGLWVPPAAPARPDPMGQQDPHAGQPPQSFRGLAQALSENYEVTPLDLSSGRIDDAIEVVVLAGPAGLGAGEVKAIDQFVMRGGALIDLAGRFRLNLGGGQLGLEEVKTGLEDLLAAWGIEVEPKLVLDPKNDSFPVPVNRDVGNGMQLREIQLLPYPFFVRVGRDAMGDAGPVTGGINSTILHWSSPIVAKAAAPATPEATKAAASTTPEATKAATPDAAAPTPPTRQALLRSSDASWLQATTDIQPDFRRHGEAGFGRPSDAAEASHELGVALIGSFPSLVATQKPPTPPADPGKPDAAKPPERLLDRSPPGTRVAVIGSSSFVSDEVLELSRTTGSEEVLANLQLVQNLVDWAVADTDLLSIRSRGRAARALDVADDARGRWEIANYLLVALGLALVVGAREVRRRRRRAMPLDPRRPAATPAAARGEA